MAKKSSLTKRGSTLYLRGAITILGLIVLAVCVFALPAGIRDPNAGIYRYLFLGMYLPAVPFYIALFHGLKLLSYIDRGQAFSRATVQSLRTIKYAAVFISVLYAIGLPFFFVLASRDDAPGVLLLALMFTFGPIVVAMITAILQQLMQNALHIKSENELTV